jgi:hypothetical protein
VLSSTHRPRISRCRSGCLVNARCGDRPQTKQRDRADLGAVLALRSIASKSACASASRCWRTGVRFAREPEGTISNYWLNAILLDEAHAPAPRASPASTTAWWTCACRKDDDADKQEKVFVG